MSASHQRVPRGQAGHNERVAVLLERYGTVMSPCASIRLHAFTEQFPADVRYLLLEELAAFKPGVILWSRTAVPTAEDVDALKAIAASVGARLIYDLDDNLLAMDEHPERDSYQGMIRAVRRSVEVADVIWCSTQRLQGALQDINRGATWMPNALDPVLWASSGSARRDWMHDGVLRVLYMGTRTHDEDFALLASAIELVHRRHPGKVRLSLIGVNAKAAAAHVWMDVLQIPGHVGASYPAFVRWLVDQRDFDLGVAPLIDSEFNRFKSSIKVLDYRALGIPTLASAVPAYVDDAENDRLLVENDPGSWADALGALIQGETSIVVPSTLGSHEVMVSRFASGVDLRWNSALYGPGTE